VAVADAAGSIALWFCGFGRAGSIAAVWAGFRVFWVPVTSVSVAAFGTSRAKYARIRVVASKPTSHRLQEEGSRSVYDSFTEYKTPSLHWVF
jgi:hypothetical protein